MFKPTTDKSRKTATPPATVAVPEPLLLDLLIDHLLVAHLVIDRPVDIRPDHVLELLTGHLLEIPITHEVGIPVEWALDHLLDHLFEMEEAILEAAEMVAEELGVDHD